jgi:hypothetical protein
MKFIVSRLLLHGTVPAWGMINPPRMAEYNRGAQNVAKQTFPHVPSIRLIVPFLYRKGK